MDNIVKLIKVVKNLFKTEFSWHLTHSGCIDRGDQRCYLCRSRVPTEWCFIVTDPALPRSQHLSVKAHCPTQLATSLLLAAWSWLNKTNITQHTALQTILGILMTAVKLLCQFLTPKQKGQPHFLAFVKTNYYSGFETVKWIKFQK